jgi:hypothetical protein
MNRENEEPVMNQPVTHTIRSSRGARTARVSGFAAMTLTALVLGLASPAAADSIGVKDPADTGHGSDLRAVQVTNGDHNVVVRTTHTNLRRDPATGSGGTVYLDTDPADRGPEYVFVGGFFVGTDYQLLHTEGFGHRQWGAPVRGSYEMTVDYAKERVRMRMSQQALGQPDEVRVSVRVAGTRSDGTSQGLVDWLGEPRSFTDWVAKG